MPEGEAALRLVELKRRNTKVEEDAVEALRRPRREQAKVAIDQFKSSRELSTQSGGPRRGGRITIERDHVRVRRGCEDRPRVTATPKGAVQIASRRARRQQLEHFAQ